MAGQGQRQKFYAVLVLLLAAWAQFATGTEVLEQARQAESQAMAAKAELLSPKTLQKGQKYLQQANRLSQQQRSASSINSAAKKALDNLIKAKSNAELGADRLGAALQAQGDAEAAEAANFSPESWARGEKSLQSAIREIESGDTAGADKKAAQAVEHFRDAELIAIKHNYLSEARRLIAQADKEKVQKYAPITLEDAGELLAAAEKELTENRYDTDRARALAREAKLQAMHALYLSRQIRGVRAKELSMEEFALQGEVPLATIADALGLAIHFADGSVAPTDEVVKVITALQEDSQELKLVQQEYSDLARENQSLAQRLGVQSSRLKRLDEIKRQHAMVEALFSFGEANVYRQANNILIRMVGLNFSSGEAVIDARYFELLRKLIAALQLFPGATVAVEGHTDAFGSDAHNLKLSQQRADAIVAYLSANMDTGKLGAIDAVGYGETRPVANNETAEGRRKNRRIDLLIKPAR